MNLDTLSPESFSPENLLTEAINRLDITGNMTGTKSSLVCYSDGNGKRKCFIDDNVNGIDCDEKECFVLYKTLNQHVVGHGKRIKSLGLDVLMVPNGLSTLVTIVGKVNKNKLITLKKIVGNEIRVKQAESLPRIFDGLPDPPSNCHLFPLSSECFIYLRDVNYTWIPGIGFKKLPEIMNNPKKMFKSEINLKGMKTFFNKKNE